MSRLKPNPNQTVESVHPRQTLLQLPADDFRKLKEAFHALLKRSRASVGRLCFLLITALIVLSLGLPSTAWAETEFQGDVSGEWTVQGSPYIQVGAASVPQDQSLTIQPGVEVVLHREQNFVIDGLLSAIGAEEDTIRFHQPDSIVAGRIRLNSDQDTSSFIFCRFDSLYDAIWSNNLAVLVENCLFVNNYSHLTLDSRWAYVAQNSFIGADDDNVRGWCSFGRNNERNRTNIVQNNTFQSYGVGFSQVDNAEFIDNVAVLTPNGRIPDLTINNCVDVTCRGNTGWFKMFISNPFRRLTRALFEENDAATIGVSEQPNWGVVIRNNRIRLECGLSSLNSMTRAEYYGNTFGIARQFQSSLTIQSFAGSEVILEGNLMYGMQIRGNSDIYMRNNTIWGGITEYIDGAENSSITAINNIFAYFDLPGYLIDPAIGEIFGGYNCFWGAEQPYGADRDLLEGDIVRDPLMRGGLPYDYRLRADSPCIDAGDPNSPRDPDGTRSDIGAFYFDQENGEPPALDRRWDYYIGWNETFRYAAKAVDEGEELDIRFEGLPEWLEIEEDEVRRDFVRDSVIVSGEVPEDEEDFVFRVIATDDADREDTLSVRVMVYPYRVLTGVVRGVLDIERSPFIVADTAWVPAGDSLVLPPGTHLYFDNREDSLADRAKSMLMVMGSIKAVGEEVDSIWIGALDTSFSNTGIQFIVSPNDYSEFRYCKLSHLRFDYTPRETNIDISNSGLVEAHLQARGHTREAEIMQNHGTGSINFNGKGIVEENALDGFSVWHGDNINIRHNIFSRLSAYFGSLDQTDSTFIRVQDNIINGSVNADVFRMGGDYQGEYHNNRIIGANAVGVELSGQVAIDFSNNIVADCDSIAFKIYPYENLTHIYNNIIINAGMAIYARYSQQYEERFQPNLAIINNAFYNIDTLLYSFRGRTTGLRHNSLHNFAFLSSDTAFNSRLTQTNINGDSVDAHFNLYLDPRLANADSLDFRLYADSPLINAGNPDSPFNDVDGSTNDIGLFGGPFGSEYEYLDPNEVLSFDKPPGEFQVGNAYPNPFNLNANISVEVPSHGIASFQLFDLQGRNIALHSVQLTAGTHRRSISEFLSLDTGSLQSGLYLLTVEFGSKRINRKLVLVK